LATIIFFSVEDAEPTESASLIVSQSGSDIMPGEVTTRGRDLKGCPKSNPSPELLSFYHLIEQCSCHQIKFSRIHISISTCSLPSQITHSSQFANIKGM
jgi:hypothetical protein